MQTSVPVGTAMEMSCQLDQVVKATAATTAGLTALDGVAGMRSRTTQSEKHEPTGVCWTNMRTQVKRTRIKNPDKNPDAFIRLNLECD
jgi:hypothetical protein